jgi:hypothetical protein
MSNPDAKYTTQIKRNDMSDAVNACKRWCLSSLKKAKIISSVTGQLNGADLMTYQVTGEWGWRKHVARNVCVRA